MIFFFFFLHEDVYRTYSVYFLLLYIRCDDRGFEGMRKRNVYIYIFWLTTPSDSLLDHIEKIIYHSEIPRFEGDAVTEQDI